MSKFPDMRLRVLFSVLAAVAALSVPCAGAVSGPDITAQVSAGPPVVDRSLDIRATGSITASENTVHAVGDVIFSNCNRRFSAEEIFYDIAADRGWMTDVYFTTCRKPDPDYHFTAEKITLLSNNRIHLRRPAFYLGKFKAISLPSIKINVGRKRVASDQFPRPGYDSNEGLTLSQRLRLSDTERLWTDADLRLTSKKGLEGNIEDRWGLDGELIELPGRYATYDSLRSSALRVPRYFPEPECVSQEVPLDRAARLIQFGRLAMRERVFDIRNTGLAVYREPEIGAAYAAPAIDLADSELDPQLELYPTAALSWGRYKEDPGTVGLTTRGRLDCALPVNLFRLGCRTAVQPLFMYSAATYGSGTNYQMFGYGVDATHLFTNGSIATVRYIKRSESGTSPFIFDTVDIFHEVQVGFQARLSNILLGYVTGYNADIGEFYNWEILLGYHTDCVMAWASYDQRWKRFMVNAALINL